MNDINAEQPINIFKVFIRAKKRLKWLKQTINKLACLIVTNMATFRLQRLVKSIDVGLKL